MATTGGPATLPHGLLDPEVPPAWEFGCPPAWILVCPAAAQTLYRIVGRSDPRLRDFQTDREKERPRGPDQTQVDYLGISMFETEDLAERNAIRYPKMIAPVRLVSGRGFTLARTEPEIEGHYAVWGDAEALLDSVDGSVSRYDAPG